MPEEAVPPPRAVVGTDALKALAVPARFAILNHLLAAGPRTATECAEVVGESPSNCSWHLRALAKAGLVERADPDEADERRRPWRAVAPGYSFSGDAGPAGRVAAAAVAGIIARHEEELFHRFSARQPALPERWRRATTANGYSLAVTPGELEALMEAVDALLRPYVRAIRTDVPEDAGAVHVSLRAFLDPDVHRDGAP